MKNKIKIGALIILIISGILIYKFIPKLLTPELSYRDKSGVNYMTMLKDKYFYIYKNGKWEKSFIKGVNIGAAKPGAFPGELAITKEDYLRWFKYIGEMNANSIRVYTILKPEFYEALYEYNTKNKEPIYLFQGIWVNEEDIINIKNAQDPKIKDVFKEDIKNIIDIVHGDKILPKNPGHASGIYEKDISSYIIGWIFGIEWDPEFVEETNKKNINNNNFQGKFLYTEKSSPFEAFLCEIGDFAISYETEKYSMQRPISFTNWLTTDMLSHPNEPNEKEDLAIVNTEHIKSKETFKPGMFASYHIYPYYPDFINYQKEYVNFKDKDGKVNPYRAYLKDLIKEHKMPVLVAEFGVPAARGMAHKSAMGFNQGNMSEKDQGYGNAFMLKNIYEEGYAGGLVFSWQDEWFKKTWNTMELDIPDRRPFWSNPQTNEQEFGLLAFDPGRNRSICYVDGEVEDWNGDKPLYEDKDLKLYVKSDEKYVYFMIDSLSFDLNKDKILIPIDTIAQQGNSKYKDYKSNFSKKADFAITIDGKDESRIKVDPYYDVFYHIYGEKLKMLEADSNYNNKDSGKFNSINLALNRKLYLPEDKKEVAFSKYETGKLFYGNGNPKSEEFNSLADFYFKNNKLEIRVPWQLINIMDPSTKMAMDDLHNNEIKPLKIQGLYTGARLIKERNDWEIIGMNLYSWEQWEQPQYHERLKPSYYILKEAFKEIKN